MGSIYRELGGSSEGPSEPLNKVEDPRVSLNMGPRAPEDRCDLLPALTWATARSGGRDDVYQAQYSVVKP